jgi:D-alanyl-D-alanine carboxypeptidase (penicillin-binding protein 5/6)
VQGSALNRFSLTVVAALALAGASSAQAAAPAPSIPRPPTAAEAPIALLYDVTSGQVLHAREPDRRFMPASVTKVMTAYVAFEMIREGRLAPRTMYTVNPRTAQEWSGKGSTMFVKAGERIMLDDLLRGITTVSANDACVVLAEGTAGSVPQWVALMNAAAGRLGMADSHFGTPNGWMDQGNTYVTANDLARLASALFTRYPQLYRNYFGHKRFAFDGLEQPNHDPITGVVPGADGIKTGFTNQAGYNFLGSGYRNGRRLVMVLAGSDRASVRNNAARAYLEWGFSQFEKRVLFDKNAIVGRADVQGGAAGSVALRAPTALAATVRRGSKANITLAIEYRGPVRAPIKAGDEIAELVIRAPGMAENRVPLAAAETIEPANGLQRLVNGIVGLMA